MRKILFGCFEVPGWGGLTTATYRLFERLLRDDLDVHYLNLVKAHDVDRFRALYGPDCENPRGLPNVHTCVLAGPLHEDRPELAVRLASLAPDLMVGVGDIATYLMKRARPEGEIVFLTAGSQQVDKQVPFTEQGIGANGRRAETRDWKEREAVTLCDHILTHSEMTRDVYRHFYPDDARKIDPRVIWFAEWIHQEAAEHAHLARPFTERTIDVLFIANTWSRAEKNYPLVESIASRLDGLSVHVVGEVPSEIASARHHGVVGDRSDLFAIMGTARVVVCPSSFDAAPGILFEASAMGCNVVASRNCGNWLLCNDALLAEPYTAEVFSEKVRRARSRKLRDNMGRFLELDCYGELVRILLADSDQRYVSLQPRRAS